MVMSRKPRNATMLAYDFYPSEGGIQTLMRSIITADCGIAWAVLTRRTREDAPLDQQLGVVRIAIRPQLRFIDRLWLKTSGSSSTTVELIAHQTEGKLLKLCRRTKAEFLFADQYWSALAVQGVARRLDIPWGLFVHGKEFLEENPEKRQLLADADLVLANSAFSKSLAVCRGAKEKRIKVVHPAVDTEVFRPPGDRSAVRRHLGINGCKALLTVAHLVSRKGHAQVIRSLPVVKLACPEVVYLVVGRGPYKGQLRALAEELGVSDAVRFCGYVPAHELPLYYGAADIHVMPSTCDGDVEGFGISFIEAAVCGTPSIGSRSGGIPDAIVDGETGFLVEPGDIDGLAERIVALLSNEKLLDQMSLAACDTATRCFSGKAFAEALRDSLNQTVF